MHIRSESELMFSGSDAPAPAKWALPVLKVKPDKPLRGIVCSPDITAHFHHYWGGRSVICLPNGCKACEAGNPQKQMGYVPMWLDRNGGRGFVEIPYSAIQYFDAQLKGTGSLERQIVRLYREKPHSFAKVRAVFEGYCDPKLVLPGFPPGRKWLLNMWGVTIGPLGASDQTGVESGLSEKTHPLIFRENAS